MNKNLWLYGVLVFAGGLIGGALTNAMCRERKVVAAPVSATDAVALPRRVVSASEFVVLDTAGKPRARIDVNGDGEAGFAMYDHANHPRARIVVDDLGAPSVRLYDTANNLRLSLEVSTDGIPTVRLMDADNHPRELLGVDAAGEAGLNFYAKDGQLLRELP